MDIPKACCEFSASNKGFIIEMPTTISCTNLMSMGPNLKNLHSNDIWKIGEAHNVSLLWPCCIKAPKPKLYSHTHLHHEETRCSCINIQAPLPAPNSHKCKKPNVMTLGYLSSIHLPLIITHKQTLQ